MKTWTWRHEHEDNQEKTKLTQSRLTLFQCYKTLCVNASWLGLTLKKNTTACFVEKCYMCIWMCVTRDKSYPKVYSRYSIPGNIKVIILYYTYYIIL